jgi:hypothetical protein
VRRYPLSEVGEGGMRRRKERKRKKRKREGRPTLIGVVAPN